MRLTVKNTFLDVSGVTVGFGPDHDDATRRCSSCPPRCSAPTSSQQKADQGGHRAAPAMPTYFTRGAKVALEWDPAGFTAAHGGRQADLMHGRAAWIASNLAAILTSLSPRGAALAEDEFQVFVRTLAGTTVTLDLKASDTIGGVKNKIEDKHRVPARMQRLLFGRTELDEDDCLIVEYGIAKECTLMLTGLLRGGGKTGAAPTPPFDASSARSAASAASSAPAAEDEAADAAPPPPFDEDSRPPYACWFPRCLCKRMTYAGLMDHARDNHSMVTSDFNGTFFAHMVKAERKKENDVRKEKAAAKAAAGASAAAEEGPPLRQVEGAAAKGAAEAAQDRTRGRRGAAAKAVAGQTAALNVAAAGGSGPASAAEAAAAALAQPLVFNAHAPNRPPTLYVVPRQTWIVCINEQWADDQAAGHKKMECSVGKGRFSSARAGDLIIIVCAGANGRVTAVCQAAAEAQSSSDPEDLRGTVLHERWDDLLRYLGDKSFTFIHVRRAWDVRGLRVTAEALVRDIRAPPLTRGWHQRFVCASKDDAVAERLLELIDGCQRHDHGDLLQSASDLRSQIEAMDNVEVTRRGEVLHSPPIRLLLPLPFVLIFVLLLVLSRPNRTFLILFLPLLLLFLLSRSRSSWCWTRGSELPIPCPSGQGSGRSRRRTRRPPRGARASGARASAWTPCLLEMRTRHARRRRWNLPAPSPRPIPWVTREARQTLPLRSPCAAQYATCPTPRNKPVQRLRKRRPRARRLVRLREPRSGAGFSGEFHVDIGAQEIGGAPLSQQLKENTMTSWPAVRGRLRAE